MNKKIKVLIAEDDLQLGFIIKDNLEEAGFEVINCPGPAISAWRRSCGGCARREGSAPGRPLG